MTALAALPLLLCGALGVRATPARAVGGSGDRVTLEVTADGADAGARLSISTNVGAVSPAEEVGPGRFRATFTPPRESYPQVALIRFALERGGELESAWLPLPIDGTETLRLETSKRGASVEVTIAGRTFGPVVANRRGVASVPVVVPPGVATARVRSVDRLGNQRVKPLDLDPPPFQRVRIVPRGAPSASWADPEPLVLDVFAVDETGAPASAPPELRADRGTLSEPRSAGGPGAFVATFRAPEKVPASPVARIGALEVALRPGPPARVLLQAQPARYRAGSGERVQLEARVEDEKGNPAPGAEPVRFSADLGDLEPEGADRASLSLPDAFGGRAAAVVVARAGGASGEASIELEAGPVAGGTIALPPDAVRAGEPPAEGTVTLEDRFGNPVPGARPVVRATGVQVELGPEAGPGSHLLRLSAADGDPAGEGTLEVRAPPSDAVISARVPVLPSTTSQGMSVGGLGEVRSNFARLHGGGALVDAALRPLPRVPLELVLQVAGSRFLRIREEDNDVRTEAEVGTISVAAGARYSVRLSPPRLAAHGAVLVGPLWALASFRLSGDGVPNELRWSEAGISFQVRAAAGVSLRLGPGRALAELQLGYAASGAPSLRGNLGGAALLAGYLLDLF